MAAFIAKQMIGSKLDSVKEATGAGKKEEEETVDDPEALREAEEARIEELERRKQKFARMEKERENVRDGIRNKYNIKKKEEETFQMPDVDGSLNAKKKTPAQLAIDPNDDEFNPVKMATDLLGKAQGVFASIPFPWNKPDDTPPPTQMPPSQ
jgi:complexin-1/2